MPRAFRNASVGRSDRREERVRAIVEYGLVPSGKAWSFVRQPNHAMKYANPQRIHTRSQDPFDALAAAPKQNMNTIQRSHSATVS